MHAIFKFGQALMKSKVRVDLFIQNDQQLTIGLENFVGGPPLEKLCGYKALRDDWENSSVSCLGNDHCGLFFSVWDS